MQKKDAYFRNYMVDSLTYTYTLPEFKNYAFVRYKLALVILLYNIAWIRMASCSIGPKVHR